MIIRNMIAQHYNDPFMEGDISITLFYIFKKNIALHRFRTKISNLFLNKK